jgi:hypothetical protein
MSKEMVSIPAGNLLSIAATKGKTTLTALKETTGADRKTLRAINAGHPVKTTTLQSIADRLRVPIEHLLASNAADKSEGVPSGINDYQYREIKLQQLDGAALRKLAGDTDEITWSLDIGQLSEELEATLKKLQKTLRDWYVHLCIGPEDEGNLLDQIRYIKNSTDFDKGVGELAQHKLKIFGSTYVAWERENALWNLGWGPAPVLKYRSQLKAALSIAPDNKTNPTVRVGIGLEPPRKFDGSDELAGIYFVEIDGRLVWSREIVSDEVAAYL